MEKSFEIHGRSDMEAVLLKYGDGYFFAPLKTDHCVFIFISKSPDSGFYTADRIRESMQIGEFDY